MVVTKNDIVVPSSAVETVELNVVLLQNGVASVAVLNTSVGVVLDVLSPVARVLGVGCGVDCLDWQKVEDGWTSVKEKKS